MGRRGVLICLNSLLPTSPVCAVVRVLLDLASVVPQPGLGTWSRLHGVGETHNTLCTWGCSEGRSSAGEADSGARKLNLAELVHPPGLGVWTFPRCICGHSPFRRGPSISTTVMPNEASTFGNDSGHGLVKDDDVVPLDAASFGCKSRHGSASRAAGELTHDVALGYNPRCRSIRREVELPIDAATFGCKSRHGAATPGSFWRTPGAF